MAEAGPEYQAKLLEGLGLSGFIMTDGNNPINLFNTANGLVGGPKEWSECLNEIKAHISKGMDKSKRMDKYPCDFSKFVFF